MAPSSTDAVKTLRKAYRTVFGRNVPARDQDNHLPLWIQVCSTLWVQGSVVKELRQILPSLPDLTWQTVAPVLGLDPSRGDEQLSGYPLQTLYLPTSFVRELLRSIQRSVSYRNGQRYYARLGSCAVKTILTELGGFVYDTEEDGLYLSSFEFELRMAHNAAILILESERWPDQSKVRAQAIAEATSAANSRLGYSFPIHIVITDLCETTLYTYDPSTKKFYKRAHFKVEEFRVGPDLNRDPTEAQTLQLLGMAGVLARDLFCLMVEGYQDFIQATIRRFGLPLALQPYAVAAERLSVYDEHSFMRHLRTIVQSTGASVEHALHVKAICHSLLSFIGFETGSDVDDKRSAYYNLPNFLGLKFELRVEAIPRTESDTPDMMVTLQWRQQKSDWQLGGSWSLCFETFFCADVASLLSNFEEIEDSRFLSSTRYAEFRDSIQVELLRPLWDSIRENIPGTETEALKRSLALIEEAKTLLSNPHGTPEEEERGVEKLRETVRLLPWESQFFSDEDIRARVEEVQRVQLSYVAR